jgi:hypothetical protein
LCLSLLSASQAFAAKRTFRLHNRIDAVTADVPNGWTVLEAEEQITFASPDNASIMTVIAGETGGNPLADIARQVSKNLGGGEVKREKNRFGEAENIYTFTFKNQNNAEFYCAISSDDFTGLYICLVMRGDTLELSNLLNSVELAGLSPPQNPKATVEAKPEGDALFIYAAIPNDVLEALRTASSGGLDLHINWSVNSPYDWRFSPDTPDSGNMYSNVYLEVNAEQIKTAVIDDRFSAWNKKTAATSLAEAIHAAGDGKPRYDLKNNTVYFRVRFRVSRNGAMRVTNWSPVFSIGGDL